jgi:hypothetical protein
MIKFSTQVLISVWKIGSRLLLTALSSTACSCLHNFSAVVFFLHAGDLVRRSACAKHKAFEIRALQELRENFAQPLEMSRKVLQRETNQYHFGGLSRRILMTW